MSLVFDVTDGIAVLTLNRPDAMNAIDAATRVQLRDAWQRVHADEAIRVAILTGSGQRAFSTGSDLKQDAGSEGFAALTFGRTHSDHLLAGMEGDKPLIAAINGYAIGGGLELALACDIRLASTSAQFALSEVKIGSLPGAGGTQRLPRTIGLSDAMLMLLTGDRVDAAEALRIGLVSRVFAPDALLGEARAIAQRIAANAPLSVRAIKRLVRDGLDMPLTAAMHAERYAFGVLRESEDRNEGRAAFQQKRPPIYKSR